MNKQATTVRAYLLRGAFLLSLAFVIVMPLALGQTRSRGSKPSVAASMKMPQVPTATGMGGGAQAVRIPAMPASQLPKATSGPAGAHAITVPPAPQAPQVVLYDQYNNAGTNATSSQDFEASLDAFDDELADDFVVPGGQSWSVESIDADGVYFNGAGPAQSFNVRFYTNSGGLPGTLVESRIGMSYTQSNSTFSVTLSPAVCLASGTYWVSVQARQDFTPAGQWGWTDRTVQSNSAAAWQNPGGGFGVCTTWGQRGATCAIDPGVPDQVYRLNGTIGCGTGTPTPTPTATPTPGPCTFQVLIVSSDVGVPPTTLQSQILAEPGVTAVDFFDAQFATPTLAQLQQYNIVVAFSNSAYFDPVATGNVLADYADTGGIVVGLNFNWYGPPFGLDGRWMTGGYTPFNSPAPTNFTNSCLGTYDMAHPLMQGIPAGSLCAFYRHTMTLSPGAVSVALYQDNEQLCAYKTNNGHTGVGINAYVGDFADTWSGPYGTVIVNAGRWLIPCATPTPTPTPGRIVLTVNERRGQDRVLVRLRWTGANTASVKIFRNGALLARVANTGSYTDVLTAPGIYTYQVCEFGTGNCSNEKRVRGP